MIENLLYLALGLLIALFIGMLIAPSIWNRAVTLTKRQLTKRINPDVKAKTAENDHRFAALAMQNQRDSDARRELDQQNTELTIELIRHREEIKYLKAEIEYLKQSGKNPESNNNALKVQIIDLAAQIAAMTAVLEGRNSAIYKALNAKDAKGKAKHSLADKIRILRKNIK